MPGKPPPNHAAHKKALQSIGKLVDLGRRNALMAKLRPQQAPKPAAEPPDEDELMQRVAAMRGG